MTEKEWQDHYEITSLKGRIWKRSELRKRAVEMLKSLLPGKTPLARRRDPAGRVAVLAVLDDATFMRTRKGMVPARVIEDVAIEAMLRLAREDSSTEGHSPSTEHIYYDVLTEQIVLVDKTLFEIKKEDDRE